MPPAAQITLLTERLLLRPYQVADFGVMYTLVSRPEAFRYPQREPLNEEDTWSRLLRHIGSWSALGYGFFAVEERTTGDFVGETGFTLFRRGVGAEYDDAPEVTWTIAPERQGRGYASEAARAAQQWADRQPGLARTLAMIHPDNAPSLRVAHKLGYRESGRVIYKDHPALFLARTAAHPRA